MSALLEAASLSKTFFSEHNALPAVCNVSFSVAPGECLGLAASNRWTLPMPHCEKIITVRSSWFFKMPLRLFTPGKASAARLCCQC